MSRGGCVVSVRESEQTKRGILFRVACVFIALASGLLSWWMSSDQANCAFPGFVVAPDIPASEPPFFRTNVINPGAPQPKSHSAALAELPGGELLAAWYAGKGEVEDDVAIYLSRRGPDGEWSPPGVIITREGVASQLGRNVISLGNPLLLSDESARVGLLFVSIAAGRWSGSSMNIAWSEDGGRTWGPVRKLTMNPLANLSALPRNPPAPLLGGGWAVPVYEEFLGKFPEILWLQPERDGWIDAVSRIYGGVSILQPALVPLDTRRAVALFRDYTSARRMSVAWSDDAGRTWSRPVPTDIPNVDSGVCAVRLSDGALLCAFNDFSPGKRENLRLAISRDEGRTWRRVATLQEEAGSEFSYPYMLARGGRVMMVYSARQKEIHFAEFNEAWVRQQEERAQ
ncbi:MAG: hypothetical protein FGM15_06920 [Chthoniobacterales bacterium]|nr:hypothetical protein [Chthoniobacterales bacterium]